MDSQTAAAMLRRRPRAPALKIDKAEHQKQVAAAVAVREAMRQNGEVPPLPDPRGRRRGDRFLRIVCGVDIGEREVAGTVTLAEFEWIAIRREHLAQWQQRRRQRMAISAARPTAVVVDVKPSQAPAVVSPSLTPLRHIDESQWRGQLKGPDDLRKLIHGGDRVNARRRWR